MTTMNSKLKTIILIIFIISLISISMAAISAKSDMKIIKGTISTGSELEDKTYASIYVGDKNAGKNAIIQIYYSRDGSLLNNGNMVPVTVKSDGYIKVTSADAYRYFPDHAQINLYDSNEVLLDTCEIDLSPSSGAQSFDLTSSSTSYSTGSHTDSSSGSGGFNSYDSGTSSSYVGNSNTGKFHAPGCSSVGKMKPSNKVFFSSRDEAISAGYVPCGRCHP